MNQPAQPPEWDRDSPIPVYIQVANLIQSRIESGELRPGTRLPNERELAGQLGVARKTISRVVRELRDRGVVVTIFGKGTYVKTEPDLGPLV